MCKMIHNKYFLILKQYLGNYKKELHGRGLIGKVHLSQKAIALTLEELEKKGLLKSRKQGNMKYYGLNLENTEIKDTINIVELLQKIQFITQHRTLAHIFRTDERIVGIFGSYAKSTQKERSDIDVFIIGNNEKLYTQEVKTYNLDISVKFFTEKEFLKLLKEKNPLTNEIIENHILLFGVEKWTNAIWRYHYGLN